MVGFPKRFKHRHTVRFGKVQVEHDQVEGFDGEQVDGRLPIMAAIDAIGKMAKAAGDCVAQRLFVLDNQNTHIVLQLIRVVP